MKLVKLKCGTWVNPKMVTRVEPIKKPTAFTANDGKPARSRIFLTGDKFQAYVEETADELAEILMGITGLPGGVQIEVKPASPGDIPPGPPDPPRPAGRTEVG